MDMAQMGIGQMTGGMPTPPSQPPQMASGYLGQQNPQMMNQMQSAANQQQQQQQQRQEEKLVVKARDLVGPLKEKWNLTLREAAHRIQTSNTDGNYAKASEREKFESHLEDFYAICDQIELNLKSAIDCMNQTTSSNRYMPIQPMPSRIVMDPSPNPAQTDFLPYPQYIATSKKQVAFANEVKQLLNKAAKDVLEQKY